MRKIRVGSRDSRLAVIQSEIVIDAIKRYDPNIEIELITMKTTGDLILDKTLDKIGGKGLFVKELDRALLAGDVDITVHSLKDMPMEVDERLPIVAYSKREAPFDVLILPEGATEFDLSMPIGCSSARRRIQLKKLFPDAVIEPVRGNVQTRFRKLDEGQYGALILAEAGIKRLGLFSRVSRVFKKDEILPAACQGIIAVQARLGENTDFLNLFNNADAMHCAKAEREFVRTLDGGCSSPVAAFAELEGGVLSLTGMYVSEDESRISIEKVVGSIADSEKMSRELAVKLKNGVTA